MIGQYLIFDKMFQIVSMVRIGNQQNVHYHNGMLLECVNAKLRVNPLEMGNY